SKCGCIGRGRRFPRCSERSSPCRACRARRTQPRDRMRHRRREPNSMNGDPFRLAAIPAVLRWPLEHALGLTTLRQLYRLARDQQPGSPPFFERRALRLLDIGLHTNPSELSALPVRGPLVVAANHPHGALDGLLLLDLVRRVRPDVRILANRLLARIPELHDSCFFVDPFEGPEAAARSRAGLRAAHLWLRGGGALIVF